VEEGREGVRDGIGWTLSVKYRQRR